MNIDITSLAQKLIDELNKNKNETDSVIKGVVLLHDAVRRQIENSNKPVGEKEVEKSTTSPAATKSRKKNS